MLTLSMLFYSVFTMFTVYTSEFEYYSYPHMMCVMELIP